ncbi:MULTISPECIES: GAF and ANTAR domain-containing protein [unclassified Amycolatopsis]|uniref:GAF and ANTAR domain-containing protein n=1 Tax=unclassified Amycolatopsis TaxID=2618356 RepID=UPI001FF24B01|nr:MULTISPECIES: GAF and ANTAR domain-containing protein [unclassified Amycolatopsis]UOZ05774.1 GAF and ANTAR domain-containing protein [Amycolatopsis sp. WQ 127309]WSK75252.1 GAF and ANTAR domain-containing protein [Amycolatopsis sp. NBC_01286]
MTGAPIPAEDLDELTAAMADLTGALETESAEEILQAVCAEAIRAIPGADMASITAIRDGEPTTAAATDDRAVDIDHVQYAAGEGPCLQAAASGEIVRVPLATAGRVWPEFTEYAGSVGVGSYLAAPLRVDEHLGGALNLFGFGDHGFAETDSQLLKLYTTIVTFGLRTTRRYHQARQRATELEAAMRSRAVIEQAKGILMAVHRISADEAMKRLITESQRTNVKLRDIAARFVAELSDGATPG